jgi:hypothetical protein
MLESVFQSRLIKELEALFKGCVILKNDENYIQGFPDLLILYKTTWAALECKREADAEKRPNQDYYINLLGEMSYANFIYPENKEEVLDELQQAFASRRASRLPRRKQISLG